MRSPYIPPVSGPVARPAQMRGAGWRIAGGLLAALLLASVALGWGVPVRAATLTVETTRFVLTEDDGKRITGAELIGRIVELPGDGGVPIEARVDAVAPAPERPSVLLYVLSRIDGAGQAHDLCDADAYGRRAAFPVAGAFDGSGQYRRTPGTWFLTCTSGSQAKCILWGYDPFAGRPGGRDLAPYYQACQHMVRAAYDGTDVAHTRNGTIIEYWDTGGVFKGRNGHDPRLAFEAGWGPDGAVCVAHTRRPELLALDVLLRSTPRLAAAACDEAEARRRGALLFNRSKVAP